MARPLLREPYVIAYSDEAVPQHVLFVEHSTGPRLRHARPRPGDWAHGVLRARQRTHRRGRPDFRAVNARRQWQCIGRGRCQICGRPARDPESGRVWWLLSDDGRSADRGYTNAPPTCRTCIPDAAAQCPHLRRSMAVYTAAGFEPYGVLANLYEPCGALAVPVEQGVELTLRDGLLGYALATQLLVVLHDLRPAPLPSAPPRGRALP
ncbi:hypothetical protein HS048_29900 [Planomonospora sp. ID91781]|uniref:hypothetical protein n=1 Tax=Planomonospora sp. ID91781 TaxID=2738135 RepID=UPI0018C389FB|nr:hypothetical protein [Planomonospora sp. ID91781]MBG0824916.1 hypothetical protein [Planomonospora sp. ID91781]